MRFCFVRIDKYCLFNVAAILGTAVIGLVLQPSLASAVEVRIPPFPSSAPFPESFSSSVRPVSQAPFRHWLIERSRRFLDSVKTRNGSELMARTTIISGLLQAGFSLSDPFVDEQIQALLSLKPQNEGECHCRRQLEHILAIAREGTTHAFVSVKEQRLLLHEQIAYGIAIYSPPQTAFSTGYPRPERQDGLECFFFGLRAVLSNVSPGKRLDREPSNLNIEAILPYFLSPRSSWTISSPNGSGTTVAALLTDRRRE